MRHMTTTVTEHATDTEIEHLEVCERCRRRISADVDLGSVRGLVLSEATAEPRSVMAKPARSVRPWVVVSSAIAVVLLLFVPLFLLKGEPDRAQPAPLLNPSNDPAAPPIPPAETESFEMVFQGSDGVVGRLIWASSSFYEGMRATVTGGRATYGYGFFRADGYGYDEGNLDPFPKDENGETIAGASPEDAAVPWAILLNSHSAEEMWTLIGGSADPGEAVPTHPLASGAYADQVNRLEWTTAGIPVLVETPEMGIWRVTSLDHRIVRAGEVGNNLDLPFDYAIHLASSTSREQLQVIGDGIVTMSDYTSAVEAVVDCAGTQATFDERSGLYRFDDAPALDECRTQHLNDVEEVWRVGSQWVGGDDLMILVAIIEGRPDEVVMFQSEPGPRTTLASGDDWTISTWQRGPGICYTTSGANFSSESCNVPSYWPVPDVLEVGIALAYNGEENPIDGHVLGLVTADADRVVITFESGDVIEVTPGDQVFNGVRGFGLSGYDLAEMGEPVTIDAMKDDSSLGSYRYGS